MTVTCPPESDPEHSIFVPSASFVSVDKFVDKVLQPACARL
jgi:hypothetical protein